MPIDEKKRKNKWAPRKSGKKTIVETLTLYYTAPQRRKPKLSSLQEKIRLRLISLHDMLLDGKPMREALKMHCENYQISNMQGYRDYRNCFALFGEVGKAEKEGVRHLVEQLAYETFKVAKEKQDVKGMAAALKIITDARRLNADDSELPDFKRLDPSLIVMALPDGQEERLQKMLAGGVVDFSASATEQPLVIEMEEVNEEEE
jgi:hypothetical protein